MFDDKSSFDGTLTVIVKQFGQHPEPLAINQEADEGDSQLQQIEAPRVTAGVT